MRLADYKKHYKETLRLGGPIMLGQLGVILVGFVDNIMVGHHGATELAAASFVNNFFALVFIFGMGFSYGLTPIIGGLFVGKEYDKAGEMLRNSLFVNFILSLLLVGIMSLLLLNIRIFNQPEELLPYIYPYYIIQLVSVVFVMLFNSYKQFCDGTTDTLTPMWVMISSNVLNIIGNYLLIYGKFGCPELGLTGAGISTLISRVTMCLFFAYLMYRGRRYERFREGYLRGKVNWTNYGRLVRLGLPVGLQMGVETASFNLSVIMMGWIGSAALAAHQVAGVITTLGFMVYYGIGAAVTIRVSGFKHLGAWREVRQASYAGLHLIWTVALMVMLFIFLFRNQLGYIFTSDEEIVHLVALLSWSVILYQAGDGLQVLFANALRGMADVKWMAWVAFCCHFGLALPIGYFCGFVLDWGAQGVWAGFPVSLTTLGLLLWRRFHVRTRAYLKA